MPSRPRRIRLHLLSVALLAACSGGSTAPASTRYTVRVIFFGGTPDSTLQTALTNAAARLSAAIVAGPGSDFPVSIKGNSLASINGFLADCGANVTATAGTISGIVIYAKDTASLGGNIVATSSPCIERLGSHLALYGVMKFSKAFLPQIIARGQINDVALHEMLHVVGFNSSSFATLPDTTSANRLIANAGTSTSGFRGPRAITACLALPLAVTSSCSPLVPLENSGGVGSVDSHWREAVFRSELMTSTLSSSGGRMPFSALTVGALADLGYTVDASVADAYTFGATSIAEPGSAAVLAEPGSVLRFDDVVQPAVAHMSPDGRFARLRPRTPR